MEDLHKVWSVIIGTFTSIWDLLVWMTSTAWNSGVQPSPTGMAATLLCIALWLASGFAAASIAERREGKRFAHMALGLLLPLFYPVALFLLMTPPKYLQQEGAEPAEPKPADGKDDKTPAAQRKTAAPPAAKPQAKPADADGPATDLEMPLPPPEKGSDTLMMARQAILKSEAKPGLSVEDLEEMSTKTPSQPFKAIAPEPPPPQTPKSDDGAMDQRYFTSLSIDENGRYRGPFMIETVDKRFLEAVRISSALPEVVVLEIPVEGGKTKSVRLPYSKILDCKLKSDWLGQ